MPNLFPCTKEIGSTPKERNILKADSPNSFFGTAVIIFTGNPNLAKDAATLASAQPYYKSNEVA